MIGCEYRRYQGQYQPRNEPSVRPGDCEAPHANERCNASDQGSCVKSKLLGCEEPVEVERTKRKHGKHATERPGGQRGQYQVVSGSRFSSCGFEFVHIYRKSQPNRHMNNTAPMIGHVHLKVSDLDRSVRFYTDILGFDVSLRWGTSAAFLSYGGYHHHLGLNTWESAGGAPPARGTTGLYHLAILFPDRQALARVLKRTIDADWPIDGAADHGVSEAIYLRDPDDNGIELYRDRPVAEWPKDDKGAMTMVNAPLDVPKLLSEA